MTWLKWIPYERPHYCNKPNSQRWFRTRFAEGSEWKCDECGQGWRFTGRESSWDDSWDTWEKIQEAQWGP